MKSVRQTKCRGRLKNLSLLFCCMDRKLFPLIQIQLHSVVCLLVVYYNI